MKISEVMTPDPACCVVGDSAHKAAIIMRELNVGIIPVVDSDESNKLVGLVTDRDLCMKVVAEGADPKSVHMRECMTGKLVTCKPDDDVETVLHLMQENQIRRIPVVDHTNVIQGIVSTADMVLCGELESGEIDETMRDISEPDLEEFQHLTHILAPEKLEVNENDGNDLVDLTGMQPPQDEFPDIRGYGV